MIVVNDEVPRQYSGSGSWERAKRKILEVRLIENPGNRGKGFGVRNGMLNANGEILLFTDADLSSPIEEASKLFAAIQAGVDVAIGSRWVQPDLQTQRQSLLRQFYGRIFNFALRILLGLKFKDTQCGFKAFTRSAALTVFPRQTIERWGFDAELLYIAQRRGLKVEEIPVVWCRTRKARASGPSSRRPSHVHSRGARDPLESPSPGNIRGLKPRLLPPCAPDRAEEQQRADSLSKISVIFPAQSSHNQKNSRRRRGLRC